MAEESIWQHSRAYILAIAAFMGIFMFGYDTVRSRWTRLVYALITDSLTGIRRWSHRLAFLPEGLQVWRVKRQSACRQEG